MPSPKSGSQKEAIALQTARNRINQRNFRSRQQAYRKELEIQVQQNQKAQIEATKEVQAAARAVAAENQDLRELLSLFVGGDHNIDILLAQIRRDRNTSVNVPENESRASRTTAQDIGSRHTQARNLSDTSQAASRSPFTMTVIDSHDPDLSRPQSSFPQTVSPDTRHRTYDEQGVENEDNNQSSQPQSSSYHSTPANHPPNGDNSMSCEQAATIIAGLRLQHADDIRGQLGCKSTLSCEVKNVELLQLMSDTI